MIGFPSHLVCTEECARQKKLSASECIARNILSPYGHGSISNFSQIFSSYAEKSPDK
jgi:hypothetical protein